MLCFLESRLIPHFTFYIPLYDDDDDDDDIL